MIIYQYYVNVVWLISPAPDRNQISLSVCISERSVSICLLQDELRTGEKAVVRFKFIKHPEYLKVGAKLLFREGVTKGIGQVTKLQPSKHCSSHHGPESVL